MGKYILKRILQMLLVVVIVAVITFMLTSMLPADPVYLIGGTELTMDEYNRIYHELNLDKPIVQRFFIWVGNALHGDFGKSYTYHKDVWELISVRIPMTLYLSFLSLLISIPLGMLFGMITALRRGSKADTVITLLANICSCLPQFWIGICLLYFLGLKMHLLPTVGLHWPSQVGLAKHLKELVMPIICLSLGGVASFTRQTRSSMLEVIRQDYIRTARSKGLREKLVISRHIMRNGMIPIVTIIGNRLAYMIGGSMFVENVFAIPGIGSLMVKSVTSSDVPTIQALVMLTTLVSCCAYLLTDIMYVVVDPRISLTSDNAD